MLYTFEKALVSCVPSSEKGRRKNNDIDLKASFKVDIFAYLVGPEYLRFDLLNTSENCTSRHEFDTPILLSKQKHNCMYCIVRDYSTVLCTS